MDGQVAPPMGNQTKTPMHTLIRVRNNQRRHRQRRREYIESLEEKLTAMEETVKQLGDENEALRKQLSLQNPPERAAALSTALVTSETTTTGVTSSTNTFEYGELWYKLSEANVTAPYGAVRSAATEFQPDLAPQRVQPQLSNGTGIEANSTPRLSLGVLVTSFSDATFPSSYVVQPSAMPSPVACCSETPPRQGLFNKDSDWRDHEGSHLSTSVDKFASSTTLCSQAYLIIQHQNRRGLSLEVIESFLWPGFIYIDEAAEGGCRVDSRLLLELLVYVSEDSDIQTRMLEEF